MSRTQKLNKSLIENDNKTCFCTVNRQIYTVYVYRSTVTRNCGTKTTTVSSRPQWWAAIAQLMRPVYTSRKMLATNQHGMLRLTSLKQAAKFKFKNG